MVYNWYRLVMGSRPMLSVIRDRPQIKVRTSFEVRTSIEVCSTSIEIRLQPHFGLIGHSLVVPPFI